MEWDKREGSGMSPGGKGQEGRWQNEKGQWNKCNLEVNYEGCFGYRDVEKR